MKRPHLLGWRRALGRLSQTPRFARGLLTVYLETQTQVGDTVEVTIFRGGVEQSIAVTLAERPG